MAILTRGLPAAQAKRRKEKIKAKEKAEKEKELEVLRKKKELQAQYNKELGEAIELSIVNTENLEILESSHFYFVVAKNVKLTVMETNTNNRFMPRSAPVEKWYTIVFRILYGHTDTDSIDESERGRLYNAVSKIGCRTGFISDISEIPWVINKVG